MDPDTMNLLKNGFYIGVAFMAMRQLVKDVNGVSKRERAEAMKNNMRFRNTIADEIMDLADQADAVEAAELKAKAARIAKRLREDS